MEWFIGVAAVVLVGIVIVGLFHGPSHRVPRGARRTDRHARGPAGDAAEGGSGATVPGPSPIVPLEPEGTSAAEPPVDPPAYVLPPPRRRGRVARRSPSRPRGRRP